MIRVIFLIIFACLGSACTGGPGGGGLKDFDANPATRPSPGFTELEIRPAASSSENSAPSLKALQLPDGFTQIHEVRLVVSHLQLLSHSIPAFDLSGPFVVRLVQGGNIVAEALPEFGGAVVANGDYNQLDLNFEKLSADQLPPEAADDPVVNGPLLGHSLVVEGSFAMPNFPPWNGISIPFRLSSDQEVTLRIETDDPFSLLGDYRTLFVAFKIQNWFDLSVLQSIFALDPSVLISGLLSLDTQSANAALQDIAQEILGRVNASLRFALSPDPFFSEDELDEASSSVVLP